jgi:hypothetical protein
MGYTGLAAIVRFSRTNIIEARNGAAYGAASTIPYSPNTTYRFRTVVNVPEHTYSAYVTPSGGREATIGTNLAFRTEQAAAVSLANVGYIAEVGAYRVCNVAVTAGDLTPPTVPGTPSAVAVTSSRVDLAWSAATDDVGVTGYEVYRAGIKVGATTRTSYSDTGLAAATAYS